MHFKRSSDGIMLLQIRMIRNSMILHMDMARQFEICQEARFVLWAVRCAVARFRGEHDAGVELERGFELADVPETTGAFLAFSRSLCAVDWPPTTWHHPRCCCVSNEEMLVLQALAEAAHRLRTGNVAPPPLWRLLLPAVAIAAIDAAARNWLATLERAGVLFPAPEELLECLRPMEGLAEPAMAGRLH